MAFITDPYTGDSAKVGNNNRLYVSSRSESIQHLISQEDQQAYQCSSTSNLIDGTIAGLHIQNVSPDQNMIITYIRHQIVGSSGGTTFPNINNYYYIALGRTYVSGGTEVEPINVFAGSGNRARVLAYTGNPTLTGTAQEIDRWYTKSDADMNVYNKEGALIVAPRNTIELSYTGDQTGGILYTRISFLMELQAT